MPRNAIIVQKEWNSVVNRAAAWILDLRWRDWVFYNTSQVWVLTTIQVQEEKFFFRCLRSLRPQENVKLAIFTS